MSFYYLTNVPRERKPIKMCWRKSSEISSKMRKSWGRRRWNFCAMRTRELTTHHAILLFRPILSLSLSFFQIDNVFDLFSSSSFNSHTHTQRHPNSPSQPRLEWLWMPQSFCGEMFTSQNLSFEVLLFISMQNIFVSILRRAHCSEFPSLLIAVG